MSENGRFLTELLDLCSSRRGAAALVFIGLVSGVWTLGFTLLHQPAVSSLNGKIALLEGELSGLKAAETNAVAVCQERLALANDRRALLEVQLAAAATAVTESTDGTEEGGSAVAANSDRAGGAAEAPSETVAETRVYTLGNGEAFIDKDTGFSFGVASISFANAIAANVAKPGEQSRYIKHASPGTPWDFVHRGVSYRAILKSVSYDDKSVVVAIMPSPG